MLKFWQKYKKYLGPVFILLLTPFLYQLVINLKEKMQENGIQQELVLTLANESLNQAVIDFLLSKNDFAWQTEEGTKNFCLFHNLYPEKELFPIYLWVRCGEFKMVEDQVKETSGISLPIKIDYPNELSYYDIEKFSYVIPRDGSFYGQDLKTIFPKEIQPRLKSINSSLLNDKIIEIASQFLFNRE